MHPTLSKALILPALLTALLLPLPAAAAPVSLHFVDADLAAVLRAAARLGGYGLLGYVTITPRVRRMLEALPGSIIVADDLLPSQLMALDTVEVAGLCTARGGPTSHVAILAAAMGLTALSDGSATEH